MERTGKCHCGSLQVIVTGEPDRVYLCHCKACQRRTGTSFHFGATYPKAARRRAKDLRARRGQRLPDSISFLPELRQHRLLGRGPQLGGLRGRGGAFDTSAFPPPNDSIFEESMHPWLGMPPSMDHYPQGRPPITNQT